MTADYGGAEHFCRYAIYILTESICTSKEIKQKLTGGEELYRLAADSRPMFRWVWYGILRVKVHEGKRPNATPLVTTYSIRRALEGPRRPRRAILHVQTLDKA